MFLNVLQREHTEQYGRLELTVTARQFFSMVNGETVECHKLPFSEMSQQEREDSADWLILVPFSILVPQMGWKSPLQRDSIGVWPMFQQYVDTVHIKRLPNPGIASLEITEAAQQELLFWAKLQEYMLVTQLLLDKIKTDKQELGFLCKSCWRKPDQFSLRTKTALLS